jgi:aminoglycoside phosphotransferase (APT) family kinase protein
VRALDDFGLKRVVGDIDGHAGTIPPRAVTTALRRYGTDTMSDVPGINVPAVTDWLHRHVPSAHGPFAFEFIAGGHSNLTYRVDGADGTRFVLRRPPLGHVLASAHDMGREFRIITGLQSSAVPVAPAFGFCDDPTVNDAPFYLMGFVDGHVLRDRLAAEAVLSPAARRGASESLVDTMVAIHAVDLDGSGLATLGKHDGYISRQLKRWYGQWNQQKTRELPAVDRVHDELLQRIPEQGPASIVHGDYRLDNCMVDAGGHVVAVLDWEICTLGDPLADLGLLQVYWTGPNDAASAWNGSATTAPGFFERDDLASRYAAVSGRDISQLPFYVSFAYWKLACILEGVYARYLGGALGLRDAAELEPFKVQVDAAAASALAHLESLA